MIGVCEQGVCWAGFDLDGAVMRARFSNAEFTQDMRLKSEGLPLALYGTDFQMKVWRELLKIPTGQTMSYKNIAQKIGHPKAHRAVGTAVGANPVSVHIPCHRVLPAAGGIGKYLWGREKKAALLKRENIMLT